MSDTDLTDDLRAAFDAANEPEAVAKAPEPVADDVVQEPVQEPEKAADEGEKGPIRGPDGKFLAKDAEKAQDAPQEPLSEVAEPPSQVVTRPPSSWSPAAKAAFAELPDDVKAAVAKREREIDAGLRSKAEEVKRYEPLEKVIAPRRTMLAMRGLNEVQAISALFEAQDKLEQNPREALTMLAQIYGERIRFGGQPQAQPQHPAQPNQGQPPEFQQLQAEIARLRQQVEQASQAPILSEVEAFKSDPSHLYFDNVRDDMALLIEAGKAKTLKEAYDMACYMNSEIRPLLIQAPVPVQQKAKVEQAKRAAASITGSPGNPVAPKSNGSIEDEIRAAFYEVAGSA